MMKKYIFTKNGNTHAGLVINYKPTTKVDFVDLRSLLQGANMLLFIFTFWVLRSDVRYDYCIKTMFGSSLPPVVCRRAHVFFTLYALVANSGVRHILCYVFALFVFVLCTLCWQFLWIVHFLSPLRYSLTFSYCKEQTC
jgi:hypothetical protein